MHTNSSNSPRGVNEIRTVWTDAQITVNNKDDGQSRKEAILDDRPNKLQDRPLEC